MEHKTQPPDALVSNIFRRHEGSVIINTVASQQEAPNLRSCFWGHVSVELWVFFSAATLSGDDDLPPAPKG